MIFLLTWIDIISAFKIRKYVTPKILRSVYFAILKSHLS